MQGLPEDQLKHRFRKVKVVSLRKHLLVALTVLVASALPLDALAQGAMVGILEGQATLVRKAARFALAEGVALQNEDIIETAPSTFVQVEFGDGGRIGIGGNARLVLAPRGSGRGAEGGTETGAGMVVSVIAR